MSAVLVAVAAGWLTARVVMSFRRASRTLDRAIEQALDVANEAGPARCLACPGQPAVADRAAHVRLFHVVRPVGVEDRADWGSRGRHPSRRRARVVDEWAAQHYPRGWAR